jgi:hypothetical protein
MPKMEVCVAPIIEETEAQIREKLTERFSALELMTQSAVNGDVRAVVVSGPAGLGKSHGVSKILEEHQPHHTIVRGYVRPTGLYKTLYEFRHPGSVVVFDDADSIFSDDISLNLLKAACDTTKKRSLSWLSETKMEDEDGDRMPRNFEFEGTVIFITNYDFDEMVSRGSKLAPHFSALISRSMYLDMAMKTKKDYLVRIKQVIEQGMLRERNMTLADEVEIVSFIESNQDKMRELSLRMVVKVAALKQSHPTKWQSLARVVCCR